MLFFFYAELTNARSSEACATSTRKNNLSIGKMYKMLNRFQRTFASFARDIQRGDPPTLYNNVWCCLYLLTHSTAVSCSQLLRYKSHLNEEKENKNWVKTHLPTPWLCKTRQTIAGWKWSQLGEGTLFPPAWRCTKRRHEHLRRSGHHRQLSFNWGKDME